LTKLKAISTLPEEPKVATLPFTKQEQSDFLRGLTNLCQRSGNRFVSVTSLAAPPPPKAPPAGAASPPPDPDALPSDVTEIKSTITFEGNYQTLRAFLGGVQRSQRLVSLSDCHVLPAQAG